jgi:hypothetical protein
MKIRLKIKLCLETVEVVKIERIKVGTKNLFKKFNPQKNNDY